MEMPDFSAVGQAVARRFPRRSFLGRLAASGLASAGLAGVGRAPATASAGKFGPLSGLAGVALVVEWTADGTLVDYESSAGFPREFAENAAKYGAAVSTMAPGLAEAYSGSTGLRWDPFRAMVVYGGEWVAVLGSNNRGAWARATQADIGPLVDAVGQRHGRSRLRRVPRKV